MFMKSERYYKVSFFLENDRYQIYMFKLEDDFQILLVKSTIEVTEKLKEHKSVS